MHKKGFIHLYKITNVTKLRNFQYRLLHNKIFCNNILYHWKKVASQKCDWCTCAKQDVIHLLHSCDKAMSIWQDLHDILNPIEKNLEFTAENIIYNRVLPGNHVINFITLVAKFVIYRCKCTNIVPHIKLKLMYHDIERYIATRDFKTMYHNKKWSPVVEFLF